MAIRVTERSRFHLPQQRIEKLRARNIAISEKLSSGLRVNRPSDDPLAAFKVQETQTHRRQVDQYDRNLKVSDTVLAHAEQSLGEALNTLYRIKELTIQSLSSVRTQQDAQSIANEMRHLQEHLRGIANTKAANRYLFGGFRQDVEPYDAAFQFVGDSNLITLEVGDGNRAQVSVPGGAIFGDGTPNTVDVFDNIIDLRAFIIAQDEPNTQNELERLEASIEQVIDERSNLGGLMSRIASARTVNADLDLRLEVDLANLQDLDFPTAVSELQLTDNALQATLASSSRLLSGTSLLDFLR